MPLTDAQIDRYSRQIIVAGLGGRGQQSLLDSRILLAGDSRDLEAPLAYLVGAGVGAIELRLSGESPSLIDDCERLIAEMRQLNPDTLVTIGSAASSSPRRFDLACMIIGSAAARLVATQLADQIDATASIVTRLDSPPLIALMPTRSPCPRCAHPALLAPFGARVESADFFAMLATAEAFKLLARYSENPEPAVIEFDGCATRPRPRTETRSF